MQKFGMFNVQRDFGMLDLFNKLKLKTLDLTIEEIIMHSRTKTSYLIKDLPGKNFKVMIEPARKSRKP